MNAKAYLAGRMQAGCAQVHLRRVRREGVAVGLEESQVIIHLFSTRNDSTLHAIYACDVLFAYNIRIQMRMHAHVNSLDRKCRGFQDSKK